MKNLKKIHVIMLSIITIFPTSIFGWSGPNHAQITRAALNALPKQERRMFGTAADSLINTYCLNPDLYRHGKRNDIQWLIDKYDPYVNLPLLQNQKQWHKNNDNNSEVCFYITTKLMYHAIQKLKEDNSLEATKYLGSLCHFLEDNVCPVHVLPDKTIAQLLPSPDYPKPMDIHRSVDKAKFKIELGHYKPRLLGDNIVEVSEAIFYRFRDNRINSRSQLVPVVQAIYDDNEKDIDTYCNAAAAPAAELLADIFHTLCVITKKNEPTLTQ